MNLDIFLHLNTSIISLQDHMTANVISPAGMGTSAKRRDQITVNTGIEILDGAEGKKDQLATPDIPGDGTQSVLLPQVQPTHRPLPFQHRVLTVTGDAGEATHSDQVAHPNHPGYAAMTMMIIGVTMRVMMMMTTMKVLPHWFG